MKNYGYNVLNQKQNCAICGLCMYSYEEPLQAYEKKIYIMIKEAPLWLFDKWFQKKHTNVEFKGKSFEKLQLKYFSLVFVFCCPGYDDDINTKPRVVGY